MATFFLCWELGGGLGHVGRLAPLARGLAARGLKVSVALREAKHGPAFFPGLQLFATPEEVPNQAERIVEPSTFADILYNGGARDAATLQRVVVAWREIFDQVRPEVLVLDFSPFALLAAQGYPTKTVLLGNGHACPPDVSPLPDCCPWRSSYPDRLVRTERRVLESLNAQLLAQREPPLERVGQLFTRATANWIATFAELDHYHDRPAGNHEYVGAWSTLPAQKLIWPDRNGARVFAYLKTAATAAPVLAELDRRGLPTVAFVPDADARSLPGSQNSSVCISCQPIDIEAASRECDLAILHSGHSVARFLHAGKPVLALPLTGEQHLMAANIARIGAGEWLHPERLELLPRYIDQILTNGRYRAAAANFAQRYVECTPARQLQQVIDRLVQLAGC